VTVGRLSTPKRLSVAGKEARVRPIAPLRASFNSLAVFRLEEGTPSIEATIPLAFP
jgi:hypothetical protein